MSSPSDTAAFRVLGIALIVEQLGKGPRMVLRYPSGGPRSNNGNSKNSRSKQQPPTLHSSSSSNNSNNNNNTNRTNNDNGNAAKNLKGSMSKNPSHRNDSSTMIKSNSDNLFFKLSGRQMSKLFRPKPSLCGQPITLTIDHTYFCCCAVLIHQSSSTGSNNSHNSTEISNPTTTASASTTTDENSMDLNNNNCTLPNDTSTTTISSSSAPATSSTTTTSTTTIPQGKDQQLVLFSVVVAIAPSSSSPSMSPTQNYIESSDMSSYSHNNPIFSCIRRVHIALARICRVLEREERRCHYVSCQILLYEQIRSELTSTSSSVDNSKTNPTTKVTTHATTAATTTTSSTAPKDTILSTTTATTISTTSGNTTTSSNHNFNNTDTNIGSVSSSVMINASNAATTSHRRSGSLNASSLDISSTTSLLPPPPPPLATASSELAKSEVSSSSSSLGLSQSQSQQPYLSFETIIQQEFELEQILLETFMTAPPTRYITSNDVEIQHAGNLAQELAQIYHALAATHRCTTDHMVPTLSSTGSKEAILSGRESVVYLNGHMAVPIEAVTTTATSSPIWQYPPEINHSTPSNDPFRSCTNDSIIRPYMTLLFPNISVDQILDALHLPMYDGEGTTTQQQPPPRRIQQFLRVWSPQKSLSDMAEMAYLPLEMVLDVAKQLIRQGLCILSPVLSYSVSFTCPNVQQIQQMTLPFYQKFGIPNIHLFVLVSYLTESNRNFGVSLSQLVRSTTHNANNAMNDDNPINTQVRLPIVTALLSRTLSNSSLYDHHNNNSNDENDDDIVHTRAIENMRQTALEDILYQMIVWLCSHQVIVPLQEYLVLVAHSSLLLSQHPPKNTRSTSASTEERKHDEIRNVSSVATTRTESMSTSTATNNNNNNNNTKNDEYICQTILHRCFSDTDLTYHSSPESQNESYSDNNHRHRNSNISSMILLLECSYRTGMEERIIRSFASRHSNQFRIVTQSPSWSD